MLLYLLIWDSPTQLLRNSFFADRSGTWDLRRSFWKSYLCGQRTLYRKSPTMTDSGSSTRRRVELPGVSLRARPRSASEAIRRRVNQRLASTGTSFESPELIQTSYSALTTYSTYSKPELRSPSTPASANREPHSMKRKKTSRPDNKHPDPSLGIPFCSYWNDVI
jgi:hypothetical protein